MRTITLTDRELHTACKQQEGILARLASPDTSISPYGKIGECLRVQERLWISEDGQYYAQDAVGPWGEWRYDVITVDGSKRYLWGRYTPTGFEDTDPRFLYPEFPHLVNSWSNRGHTLKSGRYVAAFELGFGDYDTGMRVRAGTGNTQRISHSALFLQRIKGHQMPAWAERLHIEITDTALLPFQEVLESEGKNWKYLHWAFQEHYGNACMERNPLVWRIAYRQAWQKDFAEGMCPHTPGIPAQA